jgi:hypothetical protein
VNRDGDNSLVFFGITAHRIFLFAFFDLGQVHVIYDDFLVPGSQFDDRLAALCLMDRDPTRT